MVTPTSSGAGRDAGALTLMDRVIAWSLGHRLITLLGALAAMATRYRLPFFFVLIIGTAQALSHPQLVFGRIVDPKRLLPLVLLLALFAHIVLTRRPFIGLWG